MKCILNFLLYFLTIISFVNCDRNDSTLIKINSHIVPVGRFYQIIPVEDIPLYTSSELEKRVTDFAFDELMLFDAYKIKLHNEITFKEQMDSFKRNSLIEEYLQKTIVDSIISENALLHAYANLSPRFRDAHPYSKYRARLFELALAENRDAIQNALYNLMERTANKYSLSVDDSALVYFSNLYNDRFRSLYSLNSQEVSPYTVLKAIDDDRIIVKTKKRVYSKSWLQEEISVRHIDLPYGIINPELFRNIFKTLIVEDIFYQLAQKSNLDQSPLFINNVDNYRRSQLLSRYKAKLIYSNVAANEDSLLEYYRRYKDTRYLSLSKSEVCEIFIKDSLRAVEILNLARKSKNFSALANKYTERFRDQKRPGYLGFITAEQYGGIGKTAQKLRAGEMFEQLIPSGDGFSIIKSISFVPAEPKDFESVKSIVAQNFTDYRYSMVRDSLITVLKNKYRLKIFFNNLVVD